MNALFLAQAVVPVDLILWLALAPPRSTLGFCIQFAASGGREPGLFDGRFPVRGDRIGVP